MYLLCVVFPPLALLLIGKPFQAMFNFLLCLAFWIPGVIHALMAVNEYKKDKQFEKYFAMSNANKK